jgi:DNA invertase Pin-like site-specific DNA recombinase
MLLAFEVQGAGTHMTTFGYTRVTSGPQNELALTTEAQEAAIDVYASELLHAKTVKMFNDTGVPAAVPFDQRPAAQLLLAAAKPGDVVVALRIDRVYRSPIDALRVAAHLREKEVKLHFVDLGDVTSGTTGPVFLDIISGFAQLERERSRERTLALHERHRAAGRHFAGRVPFGYSLENSFLVPDAKQQEALRRMRALRAARKSFGAIQSDLKEHFGFSLSRWGIQRIVENKRKVPEDVIPARPTYKKIIYEDGADGEPEGNAPMATPPNALPAGAKNRAGRVPRKQFKSIAGPPEVEDGPVRKQEDD